jgi:capsular polysaccharide transport system permease protein
MLMSDRPKGSQPLFSLDTSKRGAHASNSVGESLPPQPSGNIANLRQRRAALELLQNLRTPQRLPDNEETATSAETRINLPPLPAAARRPARGFYIGFALCVLLPMLLAAIYYSFIASPQYVAEFRFTVKDASARANPASNSITAIFGGIGVNNNADNYLVIDYLSSRQAAEELEKRINVRRLYSRSGIDWWSRHDADRPFERFVSYWQSMVTARFDQVTGIATAQVRAFSPEDALLIARSLVGLSEELVNGIANRTQTDGVRFAQREVDRAEERLKTIRAKLTEYRNRTGLIDPNTSVVASNAALVQTLRGSLAQLETQFATLTRQNLDPNSPALSVLQNQIRSTRDQLQKVEAMVGQDRDGVSLSRIMAEYEQLDMERQFAQTMLTSTLQALDQARASAASQSLYITPYVQPQLPQSSTYPRPTYSVLMVGFIALIAWFIGLIFLRSIRERFS